MPKHKKRSSGSKTLPSSYQSHHMLKAQVRVTLSKRLQNKEENIMVLQRSIHQRGMFCTGTNHQQTPSSKCLSGHGEEESKSERSPRRKLILQKAVFAAHTRAARPNWYWPRSTRTRLRVPQAHGRHIRCRPSCSRRRRQVIHLHSREQ